MTEYWVSQAKFWCELCKCWLTDTPTSRANHEKGTGHKLNVQRKLRELRKRQEAENKEKEKTNAELEKLEKLAERKYAEDVAKQVCSLSQHHGQRGQSSGRS
jgi:WW domain-binding protein 4